ncbi:helix-turn-helix domain-containing protein [Kitasatospora sp. NPDC058170]|uniref:helix-turn-helix domain-containing protein n=1 Tax=Kitasatospora sp. NPDC058170 TaxID=3346364 RepID=UPI0036DEFDC0
MPTTPSHAPAPGTPTVPLADLLADRALGLCQVAGPVDGRLIGTVGTSEMEVPGPYLLGGELLLTAGVRLPADAEGVDAYVRSAVGAGAAALGFGVAPVHAEVPPELVAACERHRLPLLRVPVETPFVAVGQAAYAAMAEAANRGLRQISEAQSALASAAARPDALRAVLHQLAVHLGAWTVLLDARGGELFSAGPRPAEPVLAELRALAARTTGRARSADGRGRSTDGRARSTDGRGRPSGRAQPPSAAAQHHAGGHLTVRTLPGSDGGGGPLALATAATEPPTAVHRSVAGVAVVLLSLLTSPRHALGADARSAGALVRLLLGADPAEVAPTLLPDDAPPGGHWVVVHGRLTGAARPGGDAVQLAALGTALGTPYLDLDGTRLRALLPGRHPAEPAADPEPAARLGWTLGFSAPAPGEDLRTADLQAERALRRALATGEPAVRHREAGERSVHALVAPEDAAALARARFAPLAAAGAPGPDVLLETLRTWLSLHGSWDRTAAALQLHRNTVRQRVARVGELLGVDLQDAELRMELWFALHWLRPGPDRAG